MTEQTVKVDGIVLTRTQVEKAMQELNTPPEPVFKVGDLVTVVGEGERRYLVLGGNANKIYNNLYATLKKANNIDWVRVTNGDSTLSKRPSEFRLVGRLA